MSKKEDQKKAVKVLVPIIDGLTFGIKVVEIDEALIEKQGKVLNQTEPDQFNIFVSRLERIFRDLFGL